MSTGVILTSPVYRILNADGSPCPFGKLQTYAAGTTTPLAVYTDSALTVPAANPVVMDANGEAILYLGASAYKLKEEDASGNQIRNPIDNVQGSYLTSGIGATLFADINKPIVFGATTGSANAYVFTPAVPITGYAAGQSFLFVPNFTNTGNSTINISGKGAVNITDDENNQLPKGFIIANQAYLGVMLDNGSDFAAYKLGSSQWAVIDSGISVTSYDLSAYSDPAPHQFLAITSSGVFHLPTNNIDCQGPDVTLSATSTTHTRAYAKIVSSVLTVEQSVWTLSTGAFVTSNQTITAVYALI